MTDDERLMVDEALGRADAAMTVLHALIRAMGERSVLNPGPPPR